MDIQGLLNQIYADGTIPRLARDRTAQFGTRAERLLGSELMPEREVDENEYVDDEVRYRTIIALAGTRYSPVQYKEGALGGSVKVSLFESDIGRDIKGKKLDTLRKYLGGRRTREAIAQIVNFVDVLLIRAGVHRNELWRWQAIVDGLARLRGDNGMALDVAYPNPAGHRVTAAGTWSNNAYDPIQDIAAGQTLFSGKGLSAGRAFAGTPAINILLANDNVKKRTGISVIDGSGNIVSAAAATSLTALNQILERDNLPPIERYDAQYATEEGTGHYLARNAFVMTAATGRDETIDLGDNNEPEIVNGTIGYVGMGIPSNRSEPGRAVRVTYDDEKGGGVDGQMWQTSAPVIMEPEGLFVIKNIA